MTLTGAAQRSGTDRNGFPHAFFLSCRNKLGVMALRADARDTAVTPIFLGIPPFSHDQSLISPNLSDRQG